MVAGASPAPAPLGTGDGRKKEPLRCLSYRLEGDGDGCQHTGPCKVAETGQRCKGGGRDPRRGARVPGRPAGVWGAGRGVQADVCREQQSVPWGAEAGETRGQRSLMHADTCGPPKAAKCPGPRSRVGWGRRWLPEEGGSRHLEACKIVEDPVFFLNILVSHPEV